MRSKVLVTALLALALAGCASAPPSCDGLNRRPVNQPLQAGVAQPNAGSHATD